MNVLLDTDAYSELKRGNDLVAALVRRAEQVALSSVVVGELLAGFRGGSRYQRNVRELEEFARRPSVRMLAVTWRTADRYSRIAHGLRSKGTPIPSNDIWIAAHAMECGADLISFDTHFGHIDGLAWVRPE